MSDINAVVSLDRIHQCIFICMLQDSGGFQMVSLLELAEITEEGVRFKSPHDGSMMMLTPEHSIHIQNSIGKYRCYRITERCLVTILFKTNSG